jgi:choline-sulfatase
MRAPRSKPFLLAFLGVIALACGKREAEAVPPVRPSILLITLDTTRADAIGAHTPSLTALASEGRRFRHAYATAPQTLPSHASMMTGLYPAAHGIHENARRLNDATPVLSERLRNNGYLTAAFVSAYTLDRQFGLSRGFDSYDDKFPDGKSERSASETTDAALEYLRQQSGKPLFLWVHYFDPHAPYAPPAEFRTAATPYLGEVRFMDSEMKRLVTAFRANTEAPKAIIIAADHGEGLGDHGEEQHGNLLYQGVMHVPLFIIAPSVKPAEVDEPVSTRRIFHTILDLAGLGSEQSLLSGRSEVVLGEAMQPFLQYGWQPQVMAVQDNLKVISAGRLEVYDIFRDPEEKTDLGAQVNLSREMRLALREYPIPVPGAQGAASLTDEQRRQLASLGYVTSDAKPVIRENAPRPADMAHLFALLDQSSELFVRGAYAQAIPVLERILAADPHNVGTALRLAAAHSALEQNEKALAAYRRAEAIAPGSVDVRLYLALHYVRTREYARAEPLLQSVLAEMPERLSALEAMSEIREHQGRLSEAVSLRQKAMAMQSPTPAGLLHLGALAMNGGMTLVALPAFEKARELQGQAFRHDLELGVLYLDARRLQEARAALERVPSSHPGYPMALFKRAQVSVLLQEPDAPARIATARQHADVTTRDLIARERLFKGVQ